MSYNLSTLRDYFPGWLDDDLLDMIETWKDRGMTAHQVWVDRGRKMMIAMDIATSLEEYDSYRVKEHNCTSCISNRSLARWESRDFQSGCHMAQEADEEVFHMIWRS